LTKVNVRELSQAAAGFIDLIALVFGVAAGQRERCVVFSAAVTVRRLV